MSKFNTLLQANVRGVLSGSGRRPSSDSLDEEIAHLRSQFEAAQQDQAVMEQGLTALNEEILRWDAQADDALGAGRDAEARHAIEQMECARRKLTMMQSERDDHQHALAQLMRQINQLEALAKTATQAAASDTPAQQSLSDAIRQTRQAAKASSDSTRRIQVEIEDKLDDIENQEAVEQELAARRARLAKPD